jgi:hypothetical protein
MNCIMDALHAAALGCTGSKRNSLGMAGGWMPSFVEAHGWKNHIADDCSRKNEQSFALRESLGRDA